MGFLSRFLGRNNDKLQYNYEYYYNSFVETFVEEQYKWLGALALGRVAIDMGAQSGDSSAYLISKGASYVFAYEPDKLAFNLLMHNLTLLPKNKLGVKNSKAPEPFKNELICNNTSEIIIKCDVEGDEHKIFTKDADLTGVRAIQLEYHYGVQDLKEILESKGFNVKVEEPWTISDTLGEVGWLYAIKV